MISINGPYPTSFGVAPRLLKVNVALTVVPDVTVAGTLTTTDDTGVCPIVAIYADHELQR
jgi:hypothetical protein